MDSRYVTTILLRCALMGFGSLLVWFLTIMAAGDQIYSLHSRIFDITRHDFDMMNYCGMGLVKLQILVLFLLPYGAIRLTKSDRK